MRLDELKFDAGKAGAMWSENPARVGEYYVWCSPDSKYIIRKYGDVPGDRWEEWTDLDPFTAQAVLFEICPVNPLNQNRTTEPYLDPTTSLEKSDT